MEKVSNGQPSNRALESRQVAYLSMSDLTGFYAYDHLSFPALAALGWEGSQVAWDQPNTDWGQYAAVVIRSTWDYQRRAEEFLQVLAAIERSGTVLLNSLAIVRWNIDKQYLRDLERRRVPIVPTEWMPKLDAGEVLLPLFERWQTEELVVKPTVGANADDTFRLRCDSFRRRNDALVLGQASGATWAEAERIFRSRPLMVQPFLQSIVDEGEYSLFYFDGKFSHAVLKQPAVGDFRVQEEHGGQIAATQPSPELLQAGQRAMAALPEQVLYGRVDLVRIPGGQWGVIEIELIEPSLYFPYDPSSIERFAVALDRRLRQSQTVSGNV